MFRTFERQYHCRILAWAEPTDDGVQYVAEQHGAIIVAASEALLVEALTSVVEWRIAA